MAFMALAMLQIVIPPSMAYMVKQKEAVAVAGMVYMERVVEMIIVTNMGYMEKPWVQVEIVMVFMESLKAIIAKEPGFLEFPVVEMLLTMASVDLFLVLAAQQYMDFMDMHRETVEKDMESMPVPVEQIYMIFLV